MSDVHPDPRPDPRKFFIMPQLPLPNYRTLKQLDRALGCTDLELVCVLVEIAAEQWASKEWRKVLRAKVREFKGTPPSEEIIPEVGEALWE